MALVPTFRHLLGYIRNPSKTLIVNSNKRFSLLVLSPPISQLEFRSKSQLRTLKALLSAREKTLVLTKDERLSSSSVDAEPAQSASTIAAIVTSLGGRPGAVGIVRLSGPSAVAVASCVFRPAKNKKRKKQGSGEDSWKPRSHFVEYGVVSDSQGNVVDEVIALAMLAPRSYTREDVVELQCHGSDVCLHRVLRACLEAGARLAEPDPILMRT